MTTAVNNNTAATNTGTTGTSPSADAASKTLSGDYANFLKLLTTQLKNQDPTAPTDTNQLTQQIASLSQVEQQIATNKNLEKLLSVFNVSQMGNIVSYIGKQVDATGNQGYLTGGAAEFAYSLPEGAKSSTVSISDKDGNVVFSGAGTTLAGRNEVYWDGTNSFTGKKMGDGMYTFKVTAKDEAGKDLTPTTYTTGVVTAVDSQNGTATLSLGKLSVPVSDVLSVRNVPTA